jgi:hypothetical protein
LLQDQELAAAAAVVMMMVEWTEDGIAVVAAVASKTTMFSSFCHDEKLETLHVLWELQQSLVHIVDHFSTSHYWLQDMDFHWNDDTYEDEVYERKKALGLQS